MNGTNGMNVMRTTVGFVLAGWTLGVCAEVAYEPADASGLFLDAPVPSAMEASGLSEAVVAPRSSLPMLARAWRDVTVSSGMDTTLLEMRVREGQSVKAGEVVALLDWRVARASVEAARVSAGRTAELDTAELELDLASKRVERLEKAGRAASAGDLEDARVRLSQAHASLRSALEVREQAKRNLELELARLDQYLLRSPFDGVVVAIEAQPGEMLTTGAPVVRVVDTATLRVEARVSAAEVAKLSGASAVLLRDDAGGTHVARLDFRSPLLDPASETFRVVYAIENADGGLAAGSTLLGGTDALSGVDTE